MKFKIGDWIQVKDHVNDPDFINCSIAGWQCRVIGYSEDEDPPTVCIKWSNKTISQIPNSIIRRSDEAGLNYKKMNLSINDISLILSIEDESSEGDEDEFDYGDNPEQNSRIINVIKGIGSEDVEQILFSWKRYFKVNLKFPFKAIVTEDHEDDEEISSGDMVKVTKIEIVDDLHGIIVSIIHENGKFAFPLCNLEVESQNDPNFLPVRDYAVWFANK